MIDPETLYQWEIDAADADMGRHAEVFRNARRYLALRKVGVQVPGYDFVKFDWSLDAAADRLLEGGE